MICEIYFESSKYVVLKPPPPPQNSLGWQLHPETCLAVQFLLNGFPKIDNYWTFTKEMFKIIYCVWTKCAVMAFSDIDFIKDDICWIYIMWNVPL